MSTADATSRLTAIGMEAKSIEELLSSEKKLNTLLDVIDKSGVGESCDKSTGALLVQVATRTPKNALAYRDTLAQYVGSGKISSNPQLEAALKYLTKLGNNPLEDIAGFEAACGVGVEVTPEQIKEAVEATMMASKAQIVEQRYHVNVGVFLGKIRKTLPWADGKAVREAIDAKLEAMLGPKTEEDLKPVQKTKKKAKKSSSGEKAKKEEKSEEEQLREAAGVEAAARFPSPEENTRNSPEMLKKHLEATGGITVTRFPPEPNGYLHIGHAKAMGLDFGYAADLGGKCILRFDDTNPAKESQEYIDGIIEMVEWLGHKPSEITYSSDYFQELYDLAEELIKKDLAYVDSSSGEEIKAQREKKEASPDRDRPVEESLALFRGMKAGKYEEGEYSLRMKMDITSPNPAMWDLVAYRVIYKEHPHAGDKWCLYPTYDFTHCIVDSLENVTHSLCTLEFEPRQESYYWLLDVLGLYKPLVWEYSRLNLTHTVMSKRRLMKLVEDGIVDGWDDPRMPTLVGLRRRGFTAEAINMFCDLIGVTRAANVTQYSLLEHCQRTVLDPVAPRRMCVLDPLRVEIVNFDGEPEEVEAPNHPKDESMGTRTMPFSRVVYIDREDFRMEDSKGYKRLAPGKWVGLRYGYPIKCVDVVQDAEGNVELLRAEYDASRAQKCAGYIHWVAEPAEGVAPLSVEVRTFSNLFTVEDPMELGSNWMSVVDVNSKHSMTAYAEPALADVKPYDAFQFERVGFFCVDQDSGSSSNSSSSSNNNNSKPVFNRSLPLKESKGKKAADKN